MSGISRALRQDVLDHLLMTAAWSQPIAIYVALFTVSPTATGGGTEVTGGSYARVSHALWNAATAAEPSVATNNGVITFPEATVAWGTVVAVGLYDAVTAGNFLGYDDFTGKVIDSGDVARFQDTELSVTLNETV
jgi:hypothetical protein